MSLRYSLAACVAALMPFPAFAQAPDMASTSANARLEQRAADITAALHGTKPYGDVFADAFLAAVPVSQLELLFSQLEQQAGLLQAIEVADASPVKGQAKLHLRFEKAEAMGELQLLSASPYKVGGFRIGVLKPFADTPEKLLSDFSKLHGKAGLLLQKVGADEPLLSINADESFAIGSTFKLYILSALSQDIADGKGTWSYLLTLAGPSSPGSTLHDWPDGSPITLHTLATFMISQSDNRATDILANMLGRDRLEEEVRRAGHSDPSAMQPFLTTAELFTLKQQGKEVTDRYGAADDATQRAMLAEVNSQNSPANAMDSYLTGKPVAIDTVEWFASPADISQLLAHIAQSGRQDMLDIMAVNPAMNAEDTAKWDYVGYKGGSEPGVLSLNWLLRAKDGTYYTLTMSWNDPAQLVDESAFLILANRAAAMALLPRP